MKQMMLAKMFTNFSIVPLIPQHFDLTLFISS